MNQAALNEHIGRTLWTHDGLLLETITGSHILDVLWRRWASGNDVSPYTTALPGPASQTRNAADRSGKPMTAPVNFLPYTIMPGIVAVMLGDERSLQIYKQWAERVDSWPDYIRTMERRGRYIGRLNAAQGV